MKWTSLLSKNGTYRRHAAQLSQVNCLTYEKPRKDLTDVSISEGMLPQGCNLLYCNCPRVRLLLQA